MRRPFHRLILAVLLSLLAGAVAGSPARADGGAALTALTKAADGTVSGVLTVPAGKDGSVNVDGSSLTLSIGGKTFPVATKPATSVERTTMLLIDRSGSMGASGMNAVRTSVRQFLQTVPADVKVGVVSFADEATLDVAPSLDRRAVQSAVDGLTSAGDTRLYDGVVLALQSVGTTGDRNLLILSDGKDTISTVKAKEAEKRLADSGVRAQVIAFRTDYTDDLALGYLAAAGQGSVTSVANSAGVSQAFTSAAKVLDGQVSWSVKPEPQVYGKQDIVMKGSASGGTFTATTSADLGSAPAPTSTASSTAAPGPATATALPAPAPDAASEDTSALGALTRGTVLGLPTPVAIGAFTLFVAILLLVMALTSTAFKSRRRERVESIEQYVTQTGRRAVDSVRTTNVSGIAEQLIQIGDKAVEGRESTPKTVVLLQRADLPWRAGEWAVLRVISIVVGALLGILVIHGDILLVFVGALLGVVLGLLAPPMILRFLAARRAKKFERQLPDVLTLVASSLSTGFSLPQSLDAVAHDVGQPAAKEFSRAMAETRIGSDLEESLDRMADRMDSKNMQWATMAIQIQRKVGGNLAETLRTTATTLREREALFRQVRALSAEGRLSAYILIALPIAIFLWMWLVNGEYISQLWKSFFGLAMCFVAIVLMAIGVVWMRKVIEVKV